MATWDDPPVSHDNDGQETQAKKRGRRGRAHRVRCEHPGCGKFGHSTDRCWLAHPELRPQHLLKAVGIPDQGRTSGQQTAQNSPLIPFRFLDLPQEIQDRVHNEVYRQSGALTFKTRRNPIEGDTLEYRREIPNLHLVSKKLYADSSFARKNVRGAFNGHLRCKIWPVPRIYSNPEYDAMRSKVTKLTFFGYTSSNMWGVEFARDQWYGIGIAFPNLKEVHVEWSTFRDKYKRGSNKALSKAWWDMWQPGGMKPFYNGDKDDADFPEYARLKLGYLHYCLRCLNRKGRSCNVIVTSRVKWLDSKRVPVFVQEKKYIDGKHRFKQLPRRAYRAPRNSAPVSEDW